MKWTFSKDLLPVNPGKKQMVFGVSLRNIASNHSQSEGTSNQYSENLSVDNPALEEIKFQ